MLLKIFKKYDNLLLVQRKSITDLNSFLLSLLPRFRKFILEK